jgi:hypothetical protein
MTLEEKQAVERRLAELTEANGGSLTPEAVVADAESANSPLHAHIFRQSDREAAHKHRLELARQLIRGVRVQVRTEHITYSVVGYVHDPGSKSAGYVPTVTLINQRERAHAVITREFATVEGIVTRSRELAEVLGLKDQYESLLASLQQFVAAHRSAA